MKRNKLSVAEFKKLNGIIMISAWSFILVATSLLFVSVGRWIDVRYNTEPSFMIGLLLLAICLCFGRLYFEYTKASKQIQTVKHREI